MTRRKRMTKRLNVTALLGLALTVLAACTQGEEDFRTSDEVTLQVAAIPAQVTKVTLEVDGKSYDAALGENAASLTLSNLALKNTTFTTRGLDAKGIVLYKGVETKSVTEDTDTIELTMDRLTSNVKVNLTGVVAGETLRATVGGVVQELGNSRTLAGVKTGADQTLIVEGYDGGARMRQGSASFNLSEGTATVSVTLTALGTDNVAPNAPRLSAPDTVTEGEAFTLSVDASDADGNLASIKVEWGDGSDASTATISGSAAKKDFTHTYAAAGPQKPTVTVTDAKGVSAQASMTVDVEAVDVPDDTDVNIETGKETRLVTVTATDVPAGTVGVEATITNSAGEKTVFGLVKNGATWRGSAELLNDTAYSVVLDYGGAKSDAKTFNLDDGTGDFNVTVSLGATGNTNSAPVAANDVVTLYTNDGTWTFNPVNASGTDTTLGSSADTDTDGDSLTIISFTQPAVGSLTLSGNTFTYNVPTREARTSFTYVISDGKGGEATGTVKLDVFTGVGLGG